MSTFTSLTVPVIPADTAVSRVRNIYCVGRNYLDHAKELGNAVPESPMIFGKPTHAMVPAHDVVHLPKDRQTIHHELEIVLWFERSVETDQSLAEVVAGVALGLDLTDREAQSRLKAVGHPWDFAKGFKNSAVVTDFYGVSDWTKFQDAVFTLSVNAQQVQVGKPREMIFSLQELIRFVSTQFGIGQGDVLFTGTPAGVGPVRPGDEVQLAFDGQVWSTFRFD